MAPERPQSVLPSPVEVSGHQAAQARGERLGTRSPPAFPPASAWDSHSKGIQGGLDKGGQRKTGTVRLGLCTKAEPSGPGQGLPCHGSHQPRLTMRLADEEGPNIRASLASWRSTRTFLWSCLGLQVCRAPQHGVQGSPEAAALSQGFLLLHRRTGAFSPTGLPLLLSWPLLAQ